MNSDANINEDPDKAEEAESYEIRHISIGKIKVSDFCRRSNYDRKQMDLLKESIQRRGLIHCPTVREKGIF